MNYCFFDFNQMVIKHAMGMCGSDIEELKNPTIFHDVEKECINRITKEIHRFRMLCNCHPSECYLILDGTEKYWKQYIFNNYKHKRNKSLQLLKLIERLKNFYDYYTPYRTFQHPNCESDDIISVLCKANLNINIYSMDSDFLQLGKYTNVKIFSPLKKTFVASAIHSASLIQHILTGDASDGVPNILSGNNCFTDRIRQNILKTTLIDKVISNYNSYGTITETMKVLMPAQYKKQENKIYYNIIRNIICVDLINGIPKYMEKTIVDFANKVETEKQKCSYNEYIKRFADVQHKYNLVVGDL